MKRSVRQKAALVLSLAAAAVPVAFASMRALQTGTDLRAVWMALVSFLGAALVVALAQARQRTETSLFTRSVAILVVSSLLAGLTARLLGATALFGIWAVAIAFGSCWAVSHALAVLSRPPSSVGLA